MFNVPKLCDDINTRLLDIPKENLENALSASEEGRNAAWNLGFVVTRLALRYARPEMKSSFENCIIEKQ